MTATHTPDQLRWQISPVLWLALDAAENAVVEVLGQRATVPDVRDLAEAVRQLQGQQAGQGHPEDRAVLNAEIAKRAAADRTVMVRQHITEAAFDYLLREDVANRAPAAVAAQIAADAMNGIAPLFAEAVVDMAGKVLGDLVDHPDWNHVLGAQAITETGYQVLAGASAHGARLVEFATAIAAMRLDADCDGKRCQECEQQRANGGTLDALIEKARELIGIDPAGPQDPPAGPLSAPVSPNGIGPSPDPEG